MVEPVSSAPLSGKRVLLLLIQLVAVTTSAGAAFWLCRVLFLPPLGSSGLAEARLPALVLVVALWFCRRGLAARLGNYAVVASLLSLIFFQRWLAQEDWLFGHVHGPPQLIVAICLASTIGVLAGIGWLVTRRMAKQTVPAPAVLSGSGRAARWLGNSAIVVLTLLSAILAVLSIPHLSRSGKQLDDYVERRFRDGRHSIRELAESISNPRSSKRPEMAEQMASQFAQSGDEAAISTLQRLVSDDDARVRRAAVCTLRHVISLALNSGQQLSAYPAAIGALVGGLKDEDELVQRQAALAVLEQNQIQFDDLEARLSAIAILGSAQDQVAADEAVSALLQVLEASPHDVCRRAAIRSLGGIAVKIIIGRSNTTAQVVPRLAMEVETQLPTNVRSEAVKVLAAMGPAAKRAVPSFGRAWQHHLLTIEDAQALYQIDPEAAEKLQISRPNVDPQAKDAVPTPNDALNDNDERVRQLPRVALDTIESQRPVVEGGPTVTEDTDRVQETPSAAWTSQAPFAGDPRNRPLGTIPVAFDDGYRWLITDSVVRWEQLVEGERKIQAAITATRRYEHVLGTHEFRIIDSMATPAVEGASTDPQENKTADDSTVKP